MGIKHLARPPPEGSPVAGRRRRQDLDPWRQPRPRKRTGQAPERYILRRAGAPPAAAGAVAGTGQSSAGERFIAAEDCELDRDRRQRVPVRNPPGAAPLGVPEKHLVVVRHDRRVNRRHRQPRSKVVVGPSAGTIPDEAFTEPIRRPGAPPTGRRPDRAAVQPQGNRALGLGTAKLVGQPAGLLPQSGVGCREQPRIGEPQIHGHQDDRRTLRPLFRAGSPPQKPPEEERTTGRLEEPLHDVGGRAPRVERSEHHVGRNASKHLGRPQPDAERDRSARQARAAEPEDHATETRPGRFECPIPTEGREHAQQDGREREQLGRVAEVDVAGQQHGHQPIQPSDRRADPESAGAAARGREDFPPDPTGAEPSEAGDNRQESGPGEPHRAAIAPAKSHRGQGERQGNKSHVKRRHPEAAFGGDSSGPAAVRGELPAHHVRPEVFDHPPGPHAEVVDMVVVHRPVQVAAQQAVAPASPRAEAGGALHRDQLVEVAGDLRVVAAALAGQLARRQDLDGGQQEGPRGGDGQQGRARPTAAARRLLRSAPHGVGPAAPPLAPPQEDRIQACQQPHVVGRLRVAAERHRRQDGGQRQACREAAAAEHPLGGQQGQRHPGGADQENHVADLVENVAAENVRQGRDGGRRGRSVPPPGEAIGRRQGQHRVPQHIQPVGPAIAARQGKNPRRRIEQRGRGIPRQRHAEVVERVPEGGRAGGKLLAGKTQQRIVIMP